MFTKQRTADIRTSCDAYDKQWDNVQTLQTNVIRASQDLAAARNAFNQDARWYQAGSPAFVEAAQKFEAAQIVFDAAYEAASKAWEALTAIQIGMIKSTQGLQS